jgi:hypothetical protein
VLWRDFIASDEFITKGTLKNPADHPALPSEIRDHADDLSLISEWNMIQWTWVKGRCWWQAERCGDQNHVSTLAWNLVLKPKLLASVVVLSRSVFHTVGFFSFSGLLHILPASDSRKYLKACGCLEVSRAVLCVAISGEVDPT